MRTFGISVGVIVAAHTVGYLVTRRLLARERARVQPYGRLVEVDGRRMHVRALGDGDQTVVLLAGAGVPLPSADFGPLMRLLATRFTVVCIEYLGVVHSDTTPAPRTDEDLTREIRAALSHAGLTPPYVLMPHSASGITSEYYAAQHPEEVSSIMMLDTTSSAVEAARVPALVYRLARAPQATGVSRLVNWLVVPRLLRKERGYTEREIKDYRSFVNQPLSDTVSDQNIRFPDNVHEVMQLTFPDTAPVLKLVPTGTLKRMGDDYQRDHVRRLGPSATYQAVEGSHFVHHTNARRVLEVTVDLVQRRQRTRRALGKVRRRSTVPPTPIVRQAVVSRRSPRSRRTLLRWVAVPRSCSSTVSTDRTWGPERPSWRPHSGTDALGTPVHRGEPVSGQSRRRRPGRELAGIAQTVPISGGNERRCTRRSYTATTPRRG